MSPTSSRVQVTDLSIVPSYDESGLLPDNESLLTAYKLVSTLVQSKSAIAITTPGYGGVAEALFKSCLGNKLGVELVPEISADALFSPTYGAFIVELADGVSVDDVDGVCVAPSGRHHV